MALPQPFTTSSPVIASYSYTDISTGTGFTSYYGLTTGQTTTTSYILTPYSNYSDVAFTTSLASTGSFTQETDLDFDIEFNTPKTLKGTAIISACVGAGRPDAIAAAGMVYVVFKVRKWDGSTETEIANSTTRNTAWLGATSKIEWDILSTKVVIPETQFARGETLRVTVELWGKTSTGNEARVYLLHDPMNRTDEESIQQTAGDVPPTSVIKFDMPFKLDL